ncbi:MAG: hypothetical protein Q9178_002378 [Gyalolechia marmorata]
MDQQSPADLEWQKFLKKCLLRRLPSSKFISLIRQMEAAAPRPASGSLVRALVDVGIVGQNVDPRLPTYLEALLDSKAIDVVDLLQATRQSPWPTDSPGLAPTSIDAADAEHPSLHSMILQLLTRKIANGIIEQDTVLFTFLNELLPCMAQYPSSPTLGLLVSTTLGCPVAQEAMPSAKAKKFKASFGRRLTPLVHNLSPTNIHLASALSYYQKQYGLHDEGLANPGDSMDILGGVDLAAFSFQNTVMDNEPIITRAGLYIYLNALRQAKREQGNIPVLIIDLILAAFDILANAMYRVEPQRTITTLRSFLVNKLPVFLSNYTSITFPPFSIESCISQALLRIDPTAFPSLSQMFDLSTKSNVVSEARQDFLFSCALHHLIPEGNIEVLLGDVPMQSLPASGRYMKIDLVTQCTTNPTKIEELIGELENMDGNAGEIAGALFEVRFFLVA